MSNKMHRKLFLTCKSNRRIMVSVDDALHLSEKFGVQASETGLLVVEFVFYIVWQLLDAILEDEGLLELTPEKKFRWPVRAQDMDTDGEGYCQRNGYGEKLQKINSAKSIELILQFMQHKVTSKLLSLARENMYEKMHDFRAIDRRIPISPAELTLSPSSRLSTAVGSRRLGVASSSRSTRRSLPISSQIIAGFFPPPESFVVGVRCATLPSRRILSAKGGQSTSPLCVFRPRQPSFSADPTLDWSFLLHLSRTNIYIACIILEKHALSYLVEYGSHTRACHFSGHLDDLSGITHLSPLFVSFATSSVHLSGLHETSRCAILHPPEQQIWLSGTQIQKGSENMRVPIGSFHVMKLLDGDS
ncbi:Mediator of RNA polymerase II transcription subunit 33B [Platanthera guangdongensis]|uniref:Mediator of RNA polymerase II transcription subunit 33B n=1 Tax=Platanthera guangdongensis TaxID=2320717 RepID=A0ABR2MR15_9ASPA